MSSSCAGRIHSPPPYWRQILALVRCWLSCTSSLCAYISWFPSGLADRLLGQTLFQSAASDVIIEVWAIVAAALAGHSHEFLRDRIDGDPVMRGLR